MELDPTLFEQVLAAFKAAGASADAVERPLQPGAELRDEPRLPLAADVLVTPFGVISSQARRVRLRNLSRSGAAILDGRSMHTGEKIVLHLPITDGRSIPIICVVKNSRLSGGEFRIGVEFLSRAQDVASSMLCSATGIIQITPTSAPSKLIDDLAEGRIVVGETTDRREERVEVNVQGMMSPYIQGQMGVLSRVTVKDISASGGVCIVQADTMQRGEQFVLQVPRTSGKPLTMICTVVDCKRLDESNYRIGARFETRLTPGSTEGPTNPPAPGFVARLRRWFAA